MKSVRYITIIALVFIGQMLSAQTKKSVESFNKVIISPHIETTFVLGDEESVTILESTEAEDKINIEVKGETLRVYLDDAKEITKHKKVIINGMKRKVPIYKNKVLTIVVTYKNLEALSLRGEQTTLCKSLIDVDAFRLKVYGESKVSFKDVSIKELDVTIYGESELTIEKGTIAHQKITAYGEGKINCVGVDNKNTKLTAYGEAEFTLNVSERLKVTAYGEAEVHYKGNPTIDRGIIIGEARIRSVE